ncbi:hypothetical protein FM103_08385 [Corynebacterium xerosis]|nr:hypothetical protein FM103_08385 [Corynebacterium xerosis]
MGGLSGRGHARSLPFGASRDAAVCGESRATALGWCSGTGDAACCVRRGSLASSGDAGRGSGCCAADAVLPEEKGPGKRPQGPIRVDRQEGWSSR